MMRPVRPLPLRMPFAVLAFLLAFLFLLSLVLAPKPHVILIGLDGVSPELLGQLINSGKLPNISHLAERGVFNKMVTHKFSQTRLIWPIIYTGFSPEHNGISVEMASNWENIQISPDMREAQAVWEDVANAGGWAIVLTPYESYPAERENHVMEVSDLVLQIPDLNAVPHDAYSSDKVREWSVPRIEWGVYNPWVVNTLDFVLTPIGYNGNFSTKLTRDSDNSQRILVDLDRKIRREILGVSKLANDGATMGCDLVVIYFEGTDIIQHIYNDDLPLRLSTVGSKNVEAAMQLYDAAIGKMMDAAEPGTTFCIVSDHGFDMDPGDHVTFQIRQYGEKNTIQNTVDRAWNATIGSKRLYTDIDVTDGYLLVDLNDELTKQEKQSAINLLRQEPNLFPIGLGLSDDHENGINRALPGKYVEDSVPPVGIFMLSGPHTRENQRLGISTIFDVTPTLLYALNLDVPSDMDGKTKQCCFKPNWVGSNPVKMIARLPKRKKKAAGVWQDNSRRLLELQGLGYTDGK